MFITKKELRLFRERINSLEHEVRMLNMLPKVSCFEIGDAVPEKSVVSHLFIVTEAIQKYLGLRIRYKMVDDERYSPEKRPQRKEWYAEKVKSQKPKN